MSNHTPSQARSTDLRSYERSGPEPPSATGQAPQGIEMSDDERAVRQRQMHQARRLRNRAIAGQSGDLTAEKKSSHSAIAIVEQASTEDDDEDGPQEGSMHPEDAAQRKPWESLVIGHNLGENLSYIEAKNRQVEQQRFIVKHHQQHSPHQVDHNKRILERLLKERGELEDNEENNKPQDQREKESRVQDRRDLLNWALETSKCEDEKINIRAAIEGYQSGQIPYSRNFTLIYAGQIVDTCPSYRSFCEDRSQRLDSYCAEYGPGWLWQEPPLAGPEMPVLAKKGICLEREFAFDPWDIGAFPVTLRFVVDRDKLVREAETNGTKTAKSVNGSKSAKGSQPDTKVSCYLDTMLDSGASFPGINIKDLELLDIDLTMYSAQGVLWVAGISGLVMSRFYEMYVSISTEDGDTIVGEDAQAVWPAEPRSMGGFTPVVVSTMKLKQVRYGDRLSGLLPFESCYMSSAPTRKRIWLGEDRRDVLGASRFPAHLRFHNEQTLQLNCPEEFEELREAAGTPDHMIFAHKAEGLPKGSLFIDCDLPGSQGKSELAIVRHGGPSNKTVATQKVTCEPRQGGFKKLWKRPPEWRNTHLSEKDIRRQAKNKARYWKMLEHKSKSGTATPKP